MPWRRPLKITINAHEVDCDADTRIWLHDSMKSAFLHYAPEITSLQLVLVGGTDPSQPRAIRGVVLVNATRFPIVALEVTAHTLAKAAILAIDIAVNSFEGHCADLGLAPTDPVGGRV